MLVEHLSGLHGVLGQSLLLVTSLAAASLGSSASLSVSVSLVTVSSFVDMVGPMSQSFGELESLDLPMVSVSTSSLGFASLSIGASVASLGSVALSAVSSASFHPTSAVSSLNVSHFKGFILI